MNVDEPQPSPAERADAEARAAEIRAEVAATDERRAEEELSKQREEVEKAEKRQEQLTEKEREAEAAAERAAEDAERARQTADQTRKSPGGWTPSLPFGGAGASGNAPGFAQRTEVQVGAAFAGAFVLAQVLKRVFD